MQKQRTTKTTDTKMKTNKTVARILLGAGTAFALAFVAWQPVNAQDQTQPMKPMKGGEHMLMLNHITTTAQAEALKPGDSIAMVCVKCKTVAVETVTTEKGHIKKMTPGEKHLCPGCGSTMTVVGVGKEAKVEIKHVCDKCGSDSAFCCATTKNSAPTAGMEGEKK
jgi:hypothetical protein